MPVSQAPVPEAPEAAVSTPSVCNEPKIDLRTHLYRMTGVDFTQIDGLDVLTAQTILSEVGLNPAAFPLHALCLLAWIMSG